jgi:hypothetical protein
MKRLVVLALALSLTACLPAFPNQTKANSVPSPTPDILSTAEALAGTLVVETEQSLPTPTLAATDTSTATPSPSSTPTGQTPTPTVSAATTGTTTATSAAGVIAVDKLPPGTAHGTIVIQNSSGTHADISLQCVTPQGYSVILEYDEVFSVTVKAPLGSYGYVVYVGGKRIIGGFSYMTPTKLSITIYKDHVAIH